jgi:hypothetical protein
VNNQIPSIDPKPASAITDSPKPIYAIFSEERGRQTVIAERLIGVLN